MNILGVVRNGGVGLINTLTRIEELRKRIPESRVIIATDNNADGTDLVLSEYAGQVSNTQIIRLDEQLANVSQRVERIAAARNATLSKIFGDPRPFELTLMLDLDGPNASLNVDDVLRSIRRSINWGGIFANQQEAYYDLYALRCKGWCESDVWQKIRNTKKPLLYRKRHRKALITKLVYDRQYQIPLDTPPIPVHSAFGGLGIYRTDLLSNIAYIARDTAGQLTCEHVLLNRAICERGAKLFIDPRLLTSSQREHLGPTSGAPLPDRLRKQFAI